MEEHTPEVLAYLGRIYAEDSRTHACRANSSDEFTAWQRDARSALRHLIGLKQIEDSLGGYTPSVELGDSTDMGDYTRQHGVLHSEPEVRVPFWLLRPKTAGPYPLGLFPHGHEERGLDTYVRRSRKKIATSPSRRSAAVTSPSPRPHAALRQPIFPISTTATGAATAAVSSYTVCWAAAPPSASASGIWSSCSTGRSHLST